VNRAQRYIVSLFITVAFAAPASLMAAPKAQASVELKVYDKNHKDYHNWNDHEDQAYRGYLSEQHQTYRPYAKQSHKQQDQYWNWRHGHPDKD
jgi:hypothetical protein